MEKFSQNFEASLQDYLDGKLNSSQWEALERALKEKPALREKLEALKLADSILRNLSAEQTSKNFTSSVMSRLDQYPLRTGLTITNGVLLFFGILVVMALTIILMDAGVFEQKTTFNLNSIGLIQSYLDKSVPEISVDGKLVVNIIIVLNLVLAFMVLDRAILKPLFKRRINAMN